MSGRFHGVRTCGIKRVRFKLTSIPGWVIKRADQMKIRVPETHPTVERHQQIRTMEEMWQRGSPKQL
jgi:hypothetical protein